ncbi:MAG TPA: DUF3501 family protein [Caulobacteraceae bacterium]|nr:DUF3501 family protein [Caulobacteraceae bacterium]
MPASSRRVTAEDILPDADYARERQARRAALLPVKRLRRVALGPDCTLIFENYETMLFQIQEMLLVEKGGAAQLAEELEAYNPLIPQGRELVATVMFEIDDPVRRAAILGELGGVEESFFLQLDTTRIDGVPEGDIERTRGGKTAAVHFLRFQFHDEDEAAAFHDYERRVMIGCDHPRYGHIAVLSEEARAELAKDLD